MKEINMLHRRQFIIGPEVTKINKNWNSIPINKEYFLSYCQQIPINTGKNIKGDNYILLGIAIQLDKDKKDPSEELRNSNAPIEDIVSTWAGRWVLIYNNEIHMDFAGLLGLYYTHYNGGLWISSSVKLLNDLRNDGFLDETYISKIQMKWIPLPLTNANEIYSLLPSQYINLINKEIEMKQLFPDKLLYMSEDRAISLLKDYLTTGIKNVANLNKKIWIPLSAGFDSRLVLASALYSKINFQTYTMRKKNNWSFFTNKPVNSPVSKADMVLPAKISQKVNIKHHWINASKISLEKMNLFDMHSAYRTLENDRLYYSAGQWDWIQNDDIILYGQGFEMGHAYYYRDFKYNNNKISIDDIVNKFNIKKNSLAHRSLEIYYKWHAEYRKKFNEKVDWRDIFCLEQLLSGWLSSLHQALDLVNGERIHLSNSQVFVCALLALSEDTRLKKEHQIKLIEKMSPELLEFPFNPPDPFLYSINRTITMISRKPLRFFFSKRYIKKLFGFSENN